MKYHHCSRLHWIQLSCFRFRARSLFFCSFLACTFSSWPSSSIFIFARRCALNTCMIAQLKITQCSQNTDATIGCEIELDQLWWGSVLSQEVCTFVIFLVTSLSLHSQASNCFPTISSISCKRHISFCRHKQISMQVLLSWPIVTEQKQKLKHVPRTLNVLLYLIF